MRHPGLTEFNQRLIFYDALAECDKNKAQQTHMHIPWDKL